MTQVLDYSLARPSVAEIKSAGYVGVLRYVAPAEDAPKIITAAEYAALRAAGLQVVLNWEWYANRSREGAAAGTADATSALAQANALAYQGPVYFSVDYDAPPEDQEAINEYFKACAAVLGIARLGAYGGYWPLSRLFDAGLVTFGWQTIAWSGANREARAHLLQTGATAFDGGADINDVLKPSWAGEAEAPPMNPREQQAHDVWSTTPYDATTGIHAVWMDAYNKGIVCGPPLDHEFHTVDLARNPIVCQYFGSGIRIEYYLSSGIHHGFTATSQLW